MPLHEYECDACGHRFEEIQKFSDPPVEKCPSCGALRVRKLLSSPAIQFKGSGWYITDYARKDQRAADKTAKTDGGAEKTDSGTAATDAKAESKAETKTETKSKTETRSETKSEKSSSS